MAKKQEDLDDGVARMMALQGEIDGVAFEVKRGVTRLVWEPNQPGTMEIFNFAKDIAQELGLELKGRSQSGGSDANFTGAMGIASLDSLGVLGAGLHTLNEHIFVDSLVQRAKLMAGLLMRLS
ncbi:M20/M25/M40 family metallo-hydrolase [Sulfitobacter sp.]|uniref:M20/M25/M40 family metallo-hydrolase n=1 Tax=Sulfitobacter sp. TaxID=1903071 RepID=UPI0030025109